MTNDHLDPEPEDLELPAALTALLGDPAVWSGADEADEDSIVAAVLAEVGEPGGLGGARPVRDHEARSANVVSIDDARSRRWALPALAGAAAALVLVLGVLGAINLTQGGPDAEFALAATDLAPGASGLIEITQTGVGTLIELDVDDLAPAPDGSYYEAWLRIDSEVGVSAGTFHLRDGDDRIQLWAGVSPDDYPLFTITLQDEAQTMSSGRVVLRTRLDE